MRRETLRSGASTLVAALVAAAFAALPGKAHAAQPGTDTIDATAAVMPARAEAPARVVTLSIGAGQLVRLARPMTGMFVANPGIADVQVKSPTQLYVFAKAAGATSIYATDRSGAVVWSTDIRVANNVTEVGAMLRQVMPEADIKATPVGGMVMLTGTVLAAKDAEEAQRLTETFVGAGVQVINRLHTATPQQVSLHVKIAEVSRDFVKSAGVNILSRDTTGGFLFGVAQGRSVGSVGNVDTSIFPLADVSTFYGLPAGSVQAPFNLATGRPVIPGRGSNYDISRLGQGAGKTAFAFAGKFLGLDLLTALDLAETDGLVTTLAEPNLTALSGETASFLAGGEIPIPIAQGLGAVSVQFKQYGISLQFTPTVMSGGRIALRVKPEVSELTSAGSVTLEGFTVPGIATRRADTMVELGSGQAFMIGGLLSNNANNLTDKVPGLGNLPIIGALFRSNNFRKRQTELVIVVTPYLVKPIDATAIKLPTDGYKAPTDVERILQGKSYSGTSGAGRPVPTAEGAARPSGQGGGWR
jgi:pilus assembly protein CpaC